MAPGRSLRALAFFRDARPSTVAELDRRCRWAELDEGENLLVAGEHPDRVCFLLRGDLRFCFYTRVGKVVHLPAADEGSLVCATALVPNLPLPFSIEAARPSTVASIGARAFLGLVEQDRDLMQALTRSLIERQHAFVRQIVEISTLNVPARIHSELLRLCRGGTRPDGSALIAPIPTHAELANRVGTQREAVSREMSHLQHMGIVVRRDGALFVPDVSRLVELQAAAEE